MIITYKNIKFNTVVYVLWLFMVKCKKSRLMEEGLMLERILAMDYLKKNKIFYVIILFLVIPLGLNLFFIYGDFDSGKGLGNKEWLGFWGSYLGGVATLFAVWLTLRQNERIFLQNQQNIEFQEERARISAMPYIDVNLSPDKNLHKSNLQPPNFFIILKDDKTRRTTSNLPKEYHKILESSLENGIDENGISYSKLTDICLVKLGLIQKAPSLARKIELTTKMFDSKDKPLCLIRDFTLSEGERIQLPILFDRDFPKGRYEFTINFEDIEGRPYRQIFYIQHKGGGKYNYEMVSPPEYCKNE